METWYFTFGFGHNNEGYCQPIKAKDYGTARAKMFELHGEKWAFQYGEKEWKRNKEESYFQVEQELKTIEA